MKEALYYDFPCNLVQPTGHVEGRYVLQILLPFVFRFTARLETTSPVVIRPDVYFTLKHKRG